MTEELSHSKIASNLRLRVLVLKAVILVGGEGTRLRPLTYEVPKSMVPVLNRPFLEHAIAYLKQYGIDNLILAMSYLPESFRQYFGDGSKLGAELTYSVEDNPLGTAGAVKNAEEQLTGTFVVLNGDIFTELDIADMLDFHRRKGAKATIALTWVDNPSAFGVVETDSGSRVQRFIEKPPAGQATTNWINAGIYILEPEVLEHVPASKHYMFEKRVFPLLLELGEPVYGYPFDGYWLDMGTLEKYLRLNCDLASLKTNSSLIGNLSKDKLHHGKNVIIQLSAKITGPVIIGDSCRIGSKVHIKGPVIIGADCCIADGACLENAVLWRNVNVGTGATLKQCVVGNNGQLGENEQVINCVVTSTASGLLRTEI